MNLDLAVARWTLGILTVQEMRSVAQRMLVGGTDNLELALLAGMSDEELTVEGRPLWKKAVQQLYGAQPSRIDAARTAVRAIAARIVDGKTDPYEGAREIWRVSLATADENFQDADAFIYAASEYEERPMDRTHFAKEIVAEAKRWLPA